MKNQLLLNKIRRIWIDRVAHSLARGTDIRGSFKEELEGFYDALLQTVATGDPAWLDTTLLQWASAPTKTELEPGKNNLTRLLNKMIIVTNEVVQENLTKAEALDLLVELIPIYTYWLEKAARLETESQIAYISNELVSVQRQLEQLDKSKSNFISVTAHELKTPLTLIEGYTTMMREIFKESGEKQFDTLVTGMNKGVNRLREIIDDIIDVSLIDNHLLSLNFQELWIGHIFNLLKSDLKYILDKRKQKLYIQNFPGSDLHIFADPDRIYQAMRNVMINAIKYTPDSGEITVDGRILPGFIEVTVADNGIGIEPENQLAIFEKFAQLGKPNLHSSSKSKFKGGGPGLGLPIARGIIEAHGGMIWVESEGYDEDAFPGSTFHILLPIRTEPEDPKVAKLFMQEKPQEIQSPNR
jgi:signal transduction histidine kinase